MKPRSRIARDVQVTAYHSGPVNAAKMNPENRKLRNRLSQRAFRARQAMRIKELEERLDHEPGLDVAGTARLQNQNTVLRDQMLDCHKKIASLQITMQTLAESTALALGLENIDKVCASSSRRVNGVHLTKCVVSIAARRTMQALPRP